MTKLEIREVLSDLTHSDQSCIEMNFKFNMQPTRVNAVYSVQGAELEIFKTGKSEQQKRSILR